MKSAKHLISIDDEEIRIKIPKHGDRGRGLVAYLLYLLDDDETWESIGAALGLVRPWKSAREFALRNDINWPPRNLRAGRPGRRWRSNERV